MQKVQSEILVIEAQSPLNLPLVLQFRHLQIHPEWWQGPQILQLELSGPIKYKPYGQMKGPKTLRIGQF